MICWGLIRSGQIGVFAWGLVSEARVQGQFTMGYVLISLGIAVLGAYLFWSRRQTSESVVG